MRLFHLVSLVFAVGAVAASAFGAAERRVERRFVVPADAVLTVDTFSGAVVVTEHDANEIEIAVVQSADVPDDAALEARLTSLSLEIEQGKKGGVGIRARYAKPVALSWESWPPVALNYEIKVPRRCDVDVRTLDGRIVIGSVQGDVVAINESGAIFVGEVDGSVRVRSKNGQVGVTAATGTVDVATVSGNIMVGRSAGKAHLSSRGGYIELQRASGEVVVRGNGSAAEVGFVHPISKPADISVSGAGIVLVMESAATCMLDAKASVFGKVDVRGELPLEVLSGGEGRSRLKARVNGGGPRIGARASGGNIVVRGVAPPSTGIETAAR